MNAIEYMIEFEEDGLHLYDALACDSTDAEMRTTFNLLADSQRRHLTELLELRDRLGPGLENSTLVERATHVTNGFRLLLESRDINRELKDDPDAVSHIMTSEENYIKMLEGMAKSEPIEEVRTLLGRMGEEEREHLETIVNIYDFVKAPHNFLEWGEFSNLHPL
ncbi:rubrerythrin [Geobacter sp. OR-1]|uniref:ferritin-like domain-containing protein n=1 Tax=Geobacter sp. OR-1 TaxID=1266765 RepID=UPI00054264E0|nr:ferritin family protein [Geobacter sp. OR-1]GAM09599.1 rubrerythrin [Geobacter sp. OR-1]